MPRIEIAFIIGKMKGGGVEATSLAYLKNVDSSQLHITFVVDSDSTLIPEKQIKKYGGDLVLIPPYQKQISYQRALRKLFRERRFDVVHAHISTMSVFPLYAAARAGIPVRIVHAHSTAGRGEPLKNLMKYTLRPFVKVFASDYFACSRYAGEWLFGHSAPFVVVPNAIDFDRQNYLFDPSVRAAKREELGVNDLLVIGHVGRFIPQKNHTFLIDVFQQIHERERRSVCVLAGSGELEGQIRERVRLLGLEDAVLFLGMRQDTSELYQAMDIFLLPSLYEGMPLVAMEAQAAGLPCVISDTVTRETDAGGHVTYLPIKDPALWADTVMQALPACSQSSRQEAAATAVTDAKTEGSKLESLYVQAVKARSGGVRNSSIILTVPFGCVWARSYGRAA